MIPWKKGNIQSICMPHCAGRGKKTKKNTHFTASIAAKAVTEGQVAASHHYYKMTTPTVHITPLSSLCWCDIFTLQPDPHPCLAAQFLTVFIWDQDFKSKLWGWLSCLLSPRSPLCYKCYCCQINNTTIIWAPLGKCGLIAAYKVWQALRVHSYQMQVNVSSGKVLHSIMLKGQKVWRLWSLLDSNSLQLLSDHYQTIYKGGRLIKNVYAVFSFKKELLDFNVRFTRTINFISGRSRQLFSTKSKNKSHTRWPAPNGRLKSASSRWRQKQTLNLTWHDFKSC